MENEAPLKLLLVAEGSGGHLIPALQVADAMARRGAHVKLWYAQRRHTARIAAALAQETRSASVEVDPIPLEPSSNPLGRLWQCGWLWQSAQRCFDLFAPDVVVGFGGWVSAPVVLAARRRHIGCMLHEQNVVMGQANRLLARWVDRVAVSFDGTRAMPAGAHAVVTGMPIRSAIGGSSRAQEAGRFGFSPERPTLLVLGGSQGARAINRLMIGVVGLLSSHERHRWQVLHVTGESDEAVVRSAYDAVGLTAWVAPFLVEMETAYAQADVVVARAGASTIAELSQCGKPAILIPYPYAGGHQRANAQRVEGVGGGLVIEESEASAQRILGAMRRILTDQRLRAMMGEQMRALSCTDATERLSRAIMELTRARASRGVRSAPAVTHGAPGSARIMIPSGVRVHAMRSGTERA